MAVIAKQASVTAARELRIVKKPSHSDQSTYPAAEAIAAGDMIRLDTATGRWTKANGTTAPEARATHMAWRTVAAGEALTGVRGCWVDGFVLDALAYDDPVYLSNTDGAIDTVAGTVSVIVGRVVPGHAQLLGTAADKLLDLNKLF